MPLKWHDANGNLHVTLGGDEHALRIAERERLGEDLRKLYVALTRARYATWVGFAPIAGVEFSAFGYLAGGGAELAGAGAPQHLEALRGACEDIVVREAPAAGSDAFTMHGPSRERGAARRVPRPVREHWWIASYSSLGKEGGTIGAAIGGTTGADLSGLAAVRRDAPDTRSEDVFLELLDAQAAGDDLDGIGDIEDTEAVGHPLPNASALPSAETVHGFERGANAGSFLHELMEWAANEGFAAIAKEPERLRDTVARRCNVRGWARWIEPLTGWLLHLLREPLRLPPVDGKPVPPVALGALGAYMPEMEFWVAAHAVDTRELDALVTDYTLDGAARPALDAAQLNGMLKGFIDLVFEHDGRYYVVDYKSNWLGPDDAAYTPDKMRAQILHSRYELQYVLYLFALHRLLKVRVPDYDYDRHVGGAVYVFLRGARSPGQGLHVERPPRELIEQLDALFARDTTDALGDTV
jgi:exodeoxyribonuclease V beta subunit